MIDAIMKLWPLELFLLALAVAVGRQNSVLTATKAKADANCVAIKAVSKKFDADIKAAIYNPETGLTVATPRAMCKECRADCERRMQTKHDELLSETKALGVKIEDMTKEYRLYRDDMLKQVYKAVGMLNENGGTVNQVGATIDYDRIINGVAGKINTS